MSSGAAREGSSSPAVEEEAYHSPGLSQEEGIDTLLAQYSSGGEGEGGGGEGERRVRSSRGDDEALSERVTNTGRQQAHLSPSAHITPPPCHNSPSHHSSPPHISTEHAPPKTGQTGLGGDVRSFSWDNLASQVAVETEGWLL